MRTIGIDTSYKYLNICLLEDDSIVDSLHMECFKQQSEWMIPKLEELMKKHNWKSTDIDSMVITEGPGSYTGIRIAMTVAKVFCSSMNIPLYTLGTLQLYAGILEDVCVIMDARSNRVYFARYNGGSIVKDECILEIDELNDYLKEYPCTNLIGDGQIIGMPTSFDDVVNNFMKLKDKWKYVDDIDTLVPKYLKKNEEYMVKK